VSSAALHHPFALADASRWWVRCEDSRQAAPLNNGWRPAADPVSRGVAPELTNLSVTLTGLTGRLAKGTFAQALSQLQLPNLSSKDELRPPSCDDNLPGITGSLQKPKACGTACYVTGPWCPSLSCPRMR
jgi:hypothetical protein